MRTKLYFVFGALFFSFLTLYSSGLMAFTLPGDNTISAASGDQIAPSLSHGSNSILVVWADGRANPYSAFEYETGRDIYGARFDIAGNLIDTIPIAIVSRQANQDNPKVAWNGTNWIVVYESYAVSGTGYYYQKSLEAVRVSPAGQVLDAKPIQLFGLTPSGNYWSVASDGNNWVVVNESTSVNWDIVAMRISPGGTVLDPPTKSVVKATYYGRANLKLAYAGGIFLLTFDDQYVNGLFTTSAVRFDSNLNILDSSLINFLGQSLSDLSTNGTQFFAVWNQQLPDYSMAVTGSRVNTSGQKLDGSGKNISGNFPNDSYATISGIW